MSLNISITKEVIESALNQLTFSDFGAQKVEIVDGVFANITLAGSRLNVHMTAKGWWSGSIASLSVNYTNRICNGATELNDLYFEMSSGGMDKAKDIQTYCESMERRGLAHVVLAMIAETLCSAEYQEKIISSIKTNSAISENRREEAKKKRIIEETKKKAEIAIKKEEWSIANSPLTKAQAKEKLKEIKSLNTSKKDAGTLIATQYVELETFNTRTGKTTNSLFKAMNDSGRNYWYVVDDKKGKNAARVPAEYVMQQFVGAVVTIID